MRREGEKKNKEKCCNPAASLSRSPSQQATCHSWHLSVRLAAASVPDLGFLDQECVYCTRFFFSSSTSQSALSARLVALAETHEPVLLLLHPVKGPKAPCRTHTVSDLGQSISHLDDLG